MLLLLSSHLKNIFEVEGRFKVELVLKVERKQNLHTLRISNPFIRKPQEDIAEEVVFRLIIQDSFYLCFESPKKTWQEKYYSGK